MVSRKGLVMGLLIGVLLLSVWISFSATPALAVNDPCPTGSAAPCAEDVQLSGCVQCHSIRVTGGNRNGTDRIITGSSGSSRHEIDPKVADWTSTVQAMLTKGAIGSLEIISGYLNTNYCTTCNGPILGSPAASAITDTAATVTWGTSANR